MKPRLDPFNNRDVELIVPGNYYGVMKAKEKEFRHWHYFFEAAPCQWSRMRGATHTLFIGHDDVHGCGYRPAKLLKTSAWVGIDEVDNDIVWQRWEFTRPAQAWLNEQFPREPKKYKSNLSYHWTE